MGLDRGVQLGHQRAQAFLAPAGQIQLTAVLLVGVVGLGVKGGVGGGVEVVVHVDAVHLVLRKDLGGTVADELSHLGMGDVEVPVLVDEDDVVALLGLIVVPLLDEVLVIHLLDLVLGHAAHGVDPAVDRQASLLAQLHHDGHGIVLEVTRVGADGVLAGGVDLGGVDAVGVGTELEHHGVEAVLDGVVQHLLHALAEVGFTALGGARGVNGLKIEL